MVTYDDFCVYMYVFKLCNLLSSKIGHVALVFISYLCWKVIFLHGCYVRWVTR